MHLPGWVCQGLLHLPPGMEGDKMSPEWEFSSFKGLYTGCCVSWKLIHKIKFLFSFIRFLILSSCSLQGTVLHVSWLKPFSWGPLWHSSWSSECWFSLCHSMLFEKTSSTFLFQFSRVCDKGAVYLPPSLRDVVNWERREESDKVLRIWHQGLQEGSDIVAKENLLWLWDMAMALILPYSFTASYKTGRIRQPRIECGEKVVLLFHKRTDVVFTPCFLYHWVPSAWKVFSKYLLNNRMIGWMKISFTGLQVQCLLCLDIKYMPVWWHAVIFQPTLCTEFRVCCWLLWHCIILKMSEGWCSELSTPAPY